jgi:hypothetical protein
MPLSTSAKITMMPAHGGLNHPGNGRIVELPSHDKGNDHTLRHDDHIVGHNDHNGGHNELGHNDLRHNEIGHNDFRRSDPVVRSPHETLAPHPAVTANQFGNSQARMNGGGLHFGGFGRRH